MSQTARFILRLENNRIFGPGERARMRTMAGRGLDESAEGFDLFTGLWWPLRQRNSAAPRREVAWLIAKLFARFPIRHEPCERGGSTVLAVTLGWEEGRLLEGSSSGRSFRQRFDSLLCTPLGGLEPHLHWALRVVQQAVTAKPKRSNGIDWVQLTDDLSIWDRGDKHQPGQDIRDIWAEQYWKELTQIQKEREERFYADRNSHNSEP